MRKKLFFHIGSEKCASTHVQIYFTSPSIIHHFLHKEKIFVSRKIYLETTHLFNEPTFPYNKMRTVLERNLSAILKSPLKAVFTTQEAILGLSHVQGKEGNTQIYCSTLKEICNEFEVHPIIILRRQDGFIESIYNQFIKRGEKRDFHTYYDDLPLENYKWDRVIDCVADIFGVENLHVIPMEKRVVNKSGYDSFVDVMLDCMGVEKTFDDPKFPVANPSLPRRFLEVQRSANMHLEPAEWYDLADWMSATFPKGIEDSHALMDDRMRQDLLAYYRASNQRLFDKYMKNFDGAFYLGDGVQ